MPQNSYDDKSTFPDQIFPLNQTKCVNSVTMVPVPHWPPGRDLALILNAWFTKAMLRLISLNISCGIFFRWMLHDHVDDRSTLGLVMAWCCQATTHYQDFSQKIVILGPWDPTLSSNMGPLSGWNPALPELGSPSRFSGCIWWPYFSSTVYGYTTYVYRYVFSVSVR